MVNPIVKKHFLKYGLPASVLQSISDLVMGSHEENATEEEISETCKSYDSFAKSFQSEVDTRVTKARKEQTVGKEDSDDDDKDDKKDNPSSDPVKAMLEKLLTKVTALESENNAKTYNQKASQKLKELKMNDAEVNAAMYGRNFQNDNDVDEFVEKQGEFYGEILKTRVEADLGDGTKPPGSKGESSMESFKKDVEAFNKIN